MEIDRYINRNNSHTQTQKRKHFHRAHSIVYVYELLILSNNILQQD